MRGSPRTSWTIAVILFFQTLLLCASPSQESTDRHAVRVVPANAPSQVPAGIEINVAGFMRQSFVPGPACILSADQLVLTDIENQDVYLYSLSTGEAQRVAAFGAGPGEIGTIVDVQRVGVGTGLSQIAQLSLIDDQAIALDHSELLDLPRYLCLSRHDQLSVSIRLEQKVPFHRAR